MGRTSELFAVEIAVALWLDVLVALGRRELAGEDCCVVGADVREVELIEAATVAVEWLDWTSCLDVVVKEEAFSVVLVA